MFASPARTIWLLGDSFQRGFATGVFADELTPAHPLWGLASPMNVINLVLRENGLNIRCIGGPQAIAIGSVTGGGRPAMVADFIASRPVLPDDFMLIEDAGAHNSDPSTYQATLEDIFEAMEPCRHRFTMTTFDYPAVHLLGDSYSWDVAFSGKTMNEAIEDAAAAQGVTCIDMNAIIDAYKSASLAADGVNVMKQYYGDDDGIHPGIWGQMKMAGVYLDAMGIGAEIKTNLAIRNIVANNWQSLSAGSPFWTQEKALAYADAIFG